MKHEEAKIPNAVAFGIFGASDLTRTGDLLITSEMHYRLCYTSVRLSIISAFPADVKGFAGQRMKFVRILGSYAGWGTPEARPASKERST